MKDLTNINIRHNVISISDLLNNEFISFNNFTNLVQSHPKISDEVVEEGISRFIERILLGIFPLNNINLYKIDDTHYEILRGWGYLFTIYNFINDKFELNNLRVLEDVTGKRFSDLSCRGRRKFLESTFSFYILDHTLDANEDSLNTIKEIMKY